MFEELLVMLLVMTGFLVFSVVISYILLKFTPSPLNKVILGLALIGIIIHELCHVMMSIITNAPVKSVKLLEKVKYNEKKGNQFGFRGSVTINMEKGLTFLQALLISLAPLILSFWLFFFLWDLILTDIFDIFGVIIIIFLMVSIVLAAAPSAADILCVPYAFQKNPKYSCYQILLLVLSILTYWFISILYQLILFHEIVNYLLIMVYYYGFKYGFKGFNKLLHDLLLRRNFHIEKIKKKNSYVNQMHDALD